MKKDIVETVAADAACDIYNSMDLDSGDFHYYFCETIRDMCEKVGVKPEDVDDDDPDDFGTLAGELDGVLRDAIEKFLVKKFTSPNNHNYDWTGRVTNRGTGVD